MELIMSLLKKPSFWISVAVFVVCVVLISILKMVSERFSNSKKTGKASFNARSVSAVLKYIVAIFGIITILQINGINVSSLITGLGVVGIIVGFAIQDILNDVAMGTNITWNEFFRVGDVIEYNGIQGKVIAFNLRVTKIQRIDNGSVMVISNRKITEIQCFSGMLFLDIPAPYSVPAERMRGVCGKISDEISKLEKVKSAKFCGTQSFNDSSILYRINVSCEPETSLQTRRDCLGLVQDVFEREQIAIPFNQLDVHIDRGENNENNGN